MKMELIASLIHKPDIVFLDEPTTGLDPETKRNIWALLDKVKCRQNEDSPSQDKEEALQQCKVRNLLIFKEIKLWLIFTSYFLRKFSWF